MIYLNSRRAIFLRNKEPKFVKKNKYLLKLVTLYSILLTASLNLNEYYCKLKNHKYIVERGECFIKRSKLSKYLLV